MSRAIRRHHRARLKNKRKVYHGMYHPSFRKLYSDVEFKQRVAFLVDTPTPCSCDTCGNERRNGWSKAVDKLTMQERRHLLHKADYDG